MFYSSLYFQPISHTAWMNEWFILSNSHSSTASWLLCRYFWLVFSHHPNWLMLCVSLLLGCVHLEGRFQASPLVFDGRRVSTYWNTVKAVPRYCLLLVPPHHPIPAGWLHLSRVRKTTGHSPSLCSVNWLCGNRYRSLPLQLWHNLSRVCVARTFISILEPPTIHWWLTEQIIMFILEDRKTEA